MRVILLEKYYSQRRVWWYMNRVYLTFFFIILVSCSKSEDVNKTSIQIVPQKSPQQQTIDQSFTVEGITRGATVFQENCAECHGPQAQGHPSWGTDYASGIVVAPPLDGSNEVWKRSKQQLIATIMEGIKRDGKLVMPAWKKRLNEQQIDDAIMWFQALWPAEKYEQWFQVNKESLFSDVSKQ